MARILPNPIGDITAPLERVEKGLDTVNTSLTPLEGMAADIKTMKGSLAELLHEIRALRDDLAQLR